ncbi:MAG TPA: hypothetical protein VN848_13700 [Gemmatimonadales bacterium]|nr:hypothetical protein [Gemmatimonadales bacterium]
MAIGGPETVTAWTEAEVIAEAVGGIGIIVTLCYSVWSFRTTLRDSYYAELDRVYFELLKIRLERPDLTEFPEAPNPAKAREYDAYAFMVWNFVETVFDRCQGWSKRRLRETWYPVIAEENTRHRAWFDHPDNRRKFKAHFCRFIDANYPVARGQESSDNRTDREQSRQMDGRVEGAT